jgi:hypothetical protein
VANNINSKATGASTHRRRNGQTKMVYNMLVLWLYQGVLLIGKIIGKEGDTTLNKRKVEKLRRNPPHRAKIRGNRRATIQMSDCPLTGENRQQFGKRIEARKKGTLHTLCSN